MKAIGAGEDLSPQETVERVQLAATIAEQRNDHALARAALTDDDVLATWREHLGDRADVLSRDEAIERGWFGPVTPQVRPRLGDVLVAARGDLAVVSTVDFPYENLLVGLHGSLTPAEMEIPILIA